MPLDREVLQQENQTRLTPPQHPDDAGIDLELRRAVQSLTGLAVAAAVTLPVMAPRLARAATDPIVETRYGRVRGFLANVVYAFRGIRYGASTAGEQRFRPPAPPGPWTQVVDATSYGFSTPQTNPQAAVGQRSPLADIMAASDGFRDAQATGHGLAAWRRVFQRLGIAFAI